MKGCCPHCEGKLHGGSVGSRCLRCGLELGRKIQRLAR